MKLNELPPETLQWMFTKATIEIMDINDYIERAKKHGLFEVVKSIIVEKIELRERMTTLTSQVIQAMGDIEVQKQIMSN